MLERLERFNINHFEDNSKKYSEDDVLSRKIWTLLGSREDIHFGYCDALYFDYSIIPHHIKQSLNLCRDAYFIFGITDKAEFVTKWVDRWEFDT